MTESLTEEAAWSFIGSNHEAVQRDAIDVLHHLPIRDRPRTVEVGAGTLRIESALRPWLGSWVGVEPDDRLVAHWSDYHKERRLDDASFMLRGVQDQSKDLVFARSVVSHTDPYQFGRLADAARRVLEPGGVFAFSYYPAGFRPRYWPTIMPGWRYPNLTRRGASYLITAWMKWRLKRAGFTRVERLDRRPVNGQHWMVAE